MVGYTFRMLSMKTLLIISGGIEAVPGIILAKKMGLHVVVSDGNQEAPGFDYTDDKIIASTYDVNETVKAARHYSKNIKKIDGVMCVASDVPLTVASVAESLALPGISIESAELAMDKVAMKIKFHRDGVPVPRFMQIYNRQQLETVAKDWSYPVVIKPVDSRGARGVLRLTEGVDLDWAWSHSKGNSPSGRVMVEKYLEGAQVSTESMMIQGKCYTAGFSDRNYEYLDKYAPFIIENGGDLPSHLPIELQQEVKKTVQKAALSMGVENGIIKGDIVIHNGKPFVIELAARLSGGYFCTHEIPLNSGVDLVGNAIKMAIGERIDPIELKAKYNKYICQRYIFPKKGTIKEIIGLSELKNNSLIKYFNVHAKPGQSIENPTAHPSRAGMVIAEGNSREKAQLNASAAVNSLKFIYDA
jgi:biotin carboxylase